MTEIFEHLGLTGVEGYGLYALHQVLGPALIKLGSVGDRWTEYRTRNVGVVAVKTKRKLGPAIDQPGTVHPRVAQRVIEDGSWADDDVMQEYLAGLLAASRDEDGVEDRGAYLSNIVSALTSNQVRLHHAIYSGLLGLGASKSGLMLQVMLSRELHCVGFPYNDVLAVMTVADVEHVSSVTSDALNSLMREGLVQTFRGGNARIGAPEPGFQVVPSHLGAVLYLWAYGLRATDPDDLLAPSLELQPFDPPGPVFEHVTIAGPWVAPEFMRTLPELAPQAATDETKLVDGPGFLWPSSAIPDPAPANRQQRRHPTTPSKAPRRGQTT